MASLVERVKARPQRRHASEIRPRMVPYSKQQQIARAQLKEAKSEALELELDSKLSDTEFKKTLKKADRADRKAKSTLRGKLCRENNYASMTTAQRQDFEETVVDPEIDKLIERRFFLHQSAEWVTMQQQKAIKAEKAKAKDDKQIVKDGKRIRSRLLKVVRRYKRDIHRYSYDDLVEAGDLNPKEAMLEFVERVKDRATLSDSDTEAGTDFARFSNSEAEVFLSSDKDIDPISSDKEDFVLPTMGEKTQLEDIPKGEDPAIAGSAIEEALLTTAENVPVNAEESKDDSADNAEGEDSSSSAARDGDK
ncbi:MAG: hypothetical protein M1819_002114 [Sarea resinae]|nr:MAG: hypothetical protein M1819_002114 [Sarea resinae]